LSCLDTEYGCKKTGTKFTLNLNSKTEVEIAASSSKLYEGTKATLTGKWKEEKGKWLRDIVLDTQYTNKKYGFAGQEKVTVELDTKTVKAEISASIGDDSGLSCGCMYPFKLKTDTFELVKAKGAESAFTVEQLSLGVEMKKEDITCSLLTKPQSEIELGFVKTNSNGTKLGGKFSIPADGSDDVSKVQLALNHKLDGATSLYGTFDSTGSLKGTVAKKFSDPSLTFSLTFGMDISKGYDLVQPVGVAIALGDA